MSQHLIPTPGLHHWVDELWRCAGSGPVEARRVADHLVGANLAGHDSHGVGMVPRYVQSWLADELQLNRDLRVVMDSGSMLTVDGQRGMGQSVAHAAMALAIDRARAHGVCVMGLRHAHHIGRVGHWAEQAVAAGLVSIHFVNVVSTPVVAPFGGKEARYVTDPFTVGVPVPGREPVLLDMATSALALGKVRVARNKQVKVPPNTLLDSNGQPTDDPAVMFPPPGAPRGALLPFAGHKGYALAMVCQLLGAAMIGGHTPRPEHLGMKHAVWNNMLTLVFDPARMGEAEAFGHEFSAFEDWVRSVRAEGADGGPVMPGDPERASRRARASEMPIDSGTLAELDEAARAVARASGRSPGLVSELER